MEYKELAEVKEEVAEIIKNHGGNQEVIDFRLALLLSQLGDLAKIITHDPRVNPRARPYGCFEEEVSAFGHVLVNLIACAVIREVDIEKALDSALQNWRESDWKKKVQQDTVGLFVVGETAYRGEVEGQAYLRLAGDSWSNFEGKILITDYVKPEDVVVFNKVRGIVTDHGGRHSHAGILSREFKVPCIVGTGDATQRIKAGQQIRLEASGSEGIVFVK